MLQVIPRSFLKTYIIKHIRTHTKLNPHLKTTLSVFEEYFPSTLQIFLGNIVEKVETLIVGQFHTGQILE